MQMQRTLRLIDRRAPGPRFTAIGGEDPTLSHLSVPRCSSSSSPVGEPYRASRRSPVPSAAPTSLSSTFAPTVAHLRTGHKRHFTPRWRRRRVKRHALETQRQDYTVIRTSQSRREVTSFFADSRVLLGCPCAVIAGKCMCVRFAVFSCWL